MLPKTEEAKNEIASEFLKLSKTAILAHKKAYEAYSTKNIVMLDEVKKDLANIDSIANTLDDEIVKFLALYDAEAGVLRELIGILKATSEVLSVANSAKAFAKKIKEFILEGYDFDNINEYLHHIHIASIKAFENAILMFEQKPNSKALHDLYQTVLIEESKTDDLFMIVQKEVLSTICENKQYAIDTIKLVHLLRKFERIADHSVGIAKVILYAKDGGKLEIY